MSNQKIKCYTGDDFEDIRYKILKDMENYEIVTMTSIFVPRKYEYHAEVIVIYKENIDE